MSKSKVWKFFMKSDSSTAQCEQCSKSIKTGGGTTNLRNHIKCVHPELLPEIENESNESIKKEDQPDVFKTTKGAKRQRSGRSSIWRHFKRTEDGKARCRHCLEKYNCSSSTNLKRHVMSKHPVEASETEKMDDHVEDDDDDDDSEQKPKADWSDNSSDNVNQSDEKNEYNENYEVIEYMEDSSIAKYLSSIANKPSKKVQFEPSRPSGVPDKVFDLVKEMLDARNDEFSSFGDYVAHELRTIESLKDRLELKKGIQDLIYEKQMKILNQKETALTQPGPIIEVSEIPIEISSFSTKYSVNVSKNDSIEQDP